MWVKFFIGREKDDNEKAILPALICASDSSEKFRGLAFALVWWDFGARVAFIWKKSVEEAKGEKGGAVRCQHS